MFDLRPVEAHPDWLNIGRDAAPALCRLERERVAARSQGERLRHAASPLDEGALRPFRRGRCAKRAAIALDAGATDEAPADAWRAGRVLITWAESRDFKSGIEKG